MPVPVGTKLGPYEVISLLGAGGLGEVYSFASDGERRGHYTGVKL